MADLRKSDAATKREYTKPLTHQQLLDSLERWWRERADMINQGEGVDMKLYGITQDISYILKYLRELTDLQLSDSKPAKGDSKAQS